MEGNADAAKTIRAFIAVSLPETVREVLKSLQGQLRDFGIDMKYTRPENIHLTLKFLGEIRSGDAAKVDTCMASAVSGAAPFSLKARGLGVFPNVRRPRVFWTGIVGDTDMLARLQQNIEEALAAIGFEKENKRFKGHLTLGRFKHRVDPERVASAIERFGNVASAVFMVDAVHLYESTLTPGGAIYRVLSSHRLGGE